MNETYESLQCDTMYSVNSWRNLAIHTNKTTMLILFSMIPLDERIIDDQAVESTVTMAMLYAHREESDEFCKEFSDFLKSWVGYSILRSDLERAFIYNRNLERIIYNVAVHNYIQYCYNTALPHPSGIPGHRYRLVKER